jgi:hypothetical protein
MTLLRMRTALLFATIAALAVPASAAAEYLVPPGNSAVNQYTESYPTAGGDRNSEKASGLGGSPPEQTLGKRNTQRLEAQGEDGVVVAEVAAETAPSTAPAETPDRAPAAGDGEQPGQGAKPDRPQGDAEPSPEAATAGGPKGPDAGSGGSGSSGLGEVLGQATGASTSGSMGLLLPLVVLATLAWALASLWRRRDRPTT